MWIFVILLSFLSFGASTLPNNLTFCLDFDTDASNSDKTFNGTITGATHQADTNCKSGGCYYYDGNDKIAYLDNDRFELKDGNFTICVWVNRDAYNDDGIYEKDDGATQRSYYARALSDGRFNVREQTDGDAMANGIVDLDWNHLCWVGNGNTDKWYQYIDLTNYTDNSGLTTTTSSTIDFNVGLSGGGSNYMTGYIDELCKWDRPLTPDEISELYNSGAGSFYANWSAVPEVIAGNITTIIKNVSGIVKTSFDEGEDFYIYLNHTYTGNGTSIDDSQCNISVERGIATYDAGDQNFTLCTTGCEYSTYTYAFTGIETNGGEINDDYVHFNACHQSATQTGYIDTTVQCGATSNTYRTTSAEFVLCSSGYTPIFINQSNCTNFSDINVSMTTLSPASQLKVINELNYDREFNNHVNKWNEDVFYNSTTSLYYTIHEHEIYRHGVYDINSTCINPDSTLNAVSSQEITIVNAPPQINFQTVNNSLGVTDLTQNVVIQYSDGTWTWSGSIIDDDLFSFNISFYNATGKFYDLCIDCNQTSYDTPDKLFTDFDNPYYISVYAIDTEGGNTTANLTFYVNDTIIPSLSAVSDIFLNTTTHTRGQDLIFNISFTDEALFTTAFKLYQANGTVLYYDAQLFNPVQTEYLLNDVVTALNISDSVIYGIVNATDGHTLVDVRDILEKNVYVNINNDIVTDKFTMSCNNIDYITLDYREDSVKEHIKFNGDYASMTCRFTPFDNQVTEIIDSDKYGRYLIIGDYWIDFVSNYTENVYITKLNGGQYYDVQVDFTVDNVDEIEYESIGLLNFIEKDFYITLEDAPVSTERTSITTSEALIIGLLTIVWLFMLIFPFYSRINAMYVISGLYSLMYGLFMYNMMITSYSVNLFYMLFIFAIALMYLGLYFPYKFGGRMGGRLRL